MTAETIEIENKNSTLKEIIEEAVEALHNIGAKNTYEVGLIEQSIEEAYELGRRDGANSVINSMTKQEGSMRDPALGGATGLPDTYDGLNSTPLIKNFAN